MSMCATVNVLVGRTIFRMDMGFYVRRRLWALLSSSYSIQALCFFWLTRNFDRSSYKQAENQTAGLAMG